MCWHVPSWAVGGRTPRFPGAPPPPRGLCAARVHGAAPYQAASRGAVSGWDARVVRVTGWRAGLRAGSCTRRPFPAGRCLTQRFTVTSVVSLRGWACGALLPAAVEPPAEHDHGRAPMTRARWHTMPADASAPSRWMSRGKVGSAPLGVAAEVRRHPGSGVRSGRGRSQGPFDKTILDFAVFGGPPYSAT